MITLPIIVCENGDLRRFESTQEAESYMEPVDVRNGEYEVFDSTGQVLTPFVTSEQQRILGAAISLDVTKLKESGVYQSEKLRDEVLQFLRRTGHPDPDSIDGLARALDYLL